MIDAIQECEKSVKDITLHLDNRPLKLPDKNQIKDTQQGMSNLYRAIVYGDFVLRDSSIVHLLGFFYL
jgi:hypothetical protein